MNLLVLLMPVLGLAALAAFIWLVVVAFQRSAMWGVLVLLFSPITAIVFAVMYWDDSKKPFLAYVGSCAAWIAAFTIVAVSVTAPMVKMAQEMGEVTSEQAAAFIQEQNAASQEGSTPPSTDNEDEMRQMLRQITQQANADAEASSTVPTYKLGATGSSGSTGKTTKATVETEPTKKTTARRAVRDLIHVWEIGNHVGERVRVTTTDGNEFVGVFRGQTGSELRFEKRLTSGTIDVFVDRSEVSSLHRVRRSRT